MLHSARSRNDQVATDLRLFVREQCVMIIERVTGLVKTLIARAEKEGDLVLPSYTHRQRAQPVSLAYWMGAWAEGFARDAELFRFALSGADVSPLGVGAISGTSLGTDRAFTQGLLKFTGLSGNGLDTVGDRDFALDYLYATARLLTRVGRMSTDIIDFSSSEFGFVKLSSNISMGSSMMPQKKNPDVFEILRGKSGMAIGALTGLFATVKGLPGGYNRDLQEDRGPILETAKRLDESLTLLEIGLDGISFDAEKCLAAVSDGSTQATDLAEALVKRGVAFRQAYQAVGSLVRAAKESGTPLAKLTVEQASKIDARFDAALLTTLAPREAMQRKESAGGTGPNAVKAQLSNLAKKADALAKDAAKTPRLAALFTSLESGLASSFGHGDHS